MAGDDAPKYQVLADDLRARIRSGEYAPGSLIPSKAALMKRRRLSLGTVTRAVEILAAEGLVETRQGSGTYVCDPLPPPAGQPAPVTREDLEELRAELIDELGRIEQNLADLYAKQGLDYPRDQGPGQEVTGRERLA